MRSTKFSISHIPKFSKLLLTALSEPLLVYMTVAGNSVTVLGAALFYHIELGVNPNLHGFFDAFWWAMTTVTTVGFGDIVPVTAMGRVVAMGLMVIGIAFFVGFVTILVTVVTAVSTRDLESAEMRMESDLKRVLVELAEIKSKI